jgi:O-antigen/teichoic acid export membrane protein
VKDAFLWTLKSLGILLAPVTAFMFFAADDLLRWVDGGRWLEAVPMVRWLAIAAFVRCIAQTFPQVFHAMRRPLFAVYDSIFTMLVLLSLLIGTLLVWGKSEGAIVAAWTWAAVYPITALLSFAMVRVLIPIRARELLVCFHHTAGALLSMSAAAVAFELGLRAYLPAVAAPFVLTALLLAGYAAYARLVMGVTLTGLVARRSANGQ